MLLSAFNVFWKLIRKRCVMISCLTSHRCILAWNIAIAGARTVLNFNYSSHLLPSFTPSHPLWQKLPYFLVIIVLHWHFSQSAQLPQRNLIVSRPWNWLDSMLLCPMRYPDHHHYILIDSLWNYLVIGCLIIQSIFQFLVELYHVSAPLLWIPIELPFHMHGWLHPKKELGLGLWALFIPYITSFLVLLLCRIFHRPVWGLE